MNACSSVRIYSSRSFHMSIGVFFSHVKNGHSFLVVVPNGDAAAYIYFTAKRRSNSHSLCLPYKVFPSRYAELYVVNENLSMEKIVLLILLFLFLNLHFLFENDCLLHVFHKKNTPLCNIFYRSLK